MDGHGSVASKAGSPQTHAWRCSGHVLALDRPRVMGILNVTPDSFSDGGRYFALDDALRHAEQLHAQGADLIDVGGESTRPGSSEVSGETESARVLPVISALAGRGYLVSVDTRHAEVARRAVEAGASVINDVSGFRDPAMRQVARGCDAGLVVMHMLGSPKTMQHDPRYTDVVREVRAYLLERAALLEREGVERERICLDPGPGFGKTVEHNVQLLDRFDELCDAGYPVLAATSRKSFVGEVFGRPEPSGRVWPSVATAVEAVCRGAACVRVHDVAETRAALDALARPAHEAIVGMGSNQGNRVSHLAWAAERIDALPATSVTARSPIYESAPAYYLDQPAFANAVLVVSTRLHPRVLLAELQRLELAAGRVRTFRNAPRPLDLDILDYAGTVCSGDDLVLPHPRLTERDFVVRPLLDVAPGFVLSDGTRVCREAVSVGMACGVLRSADAWRTA